MKGRKLLSAVIAGAMVLGTMSFPVFAANETYTVDATHTLENVISEINTSASGDVVINLDTDANFSFGARTQIGNENTTSITIDGGNNVLDLLGTDTDWSSLGNAGGKLVFKNVTINKTEGGNGAWNNHAFNITSYVEFDNVTVNNAVTIHDGGKFTNTNFYEAGEYYTLYIPAVDQDVVIENCTFKGSKASTRAKNYMKEAINLDTPDPETHGLNAVWVAQDRTDNKNITITNNVFDGVTRGVGTHKYSQKNGENVYHENVVITNNTFKNIFDNGVFILNWKNATIENNTFNKIGLKSKKTYSSGAHAISGGGIEGIHVKNNIFSNVKRNPIYFCVQQNVGSASSYSKVKTNITKEQTEEMLTNTVSNCGYDMNVIFKGYDILYFRGNSERTRENAVAINLKKQEISWGIEK